MTRDTSCRRRDVLISMSCVVATSTLPFAGGAFSRSGANRDPPNIVFILADDMGYADLSCYGRRDYVTPCLDKLAAQGAQFMQGYANSPVCSPTRIALITGRYQYRLRAGLEEPIDSARDIGLPPNHPTLPSLLRALGYRTSLVGKWHMGNLPNFGPLKSGYDRFFGIYDGSTDYFKHYLTRQSGEYAHLYEGEKRVDHPGYLTDVLAGCAINEIEMYRKERRPFLLSLHFTAPHWPWEGPGDEAVSQAIEKPVHLDGGSIKTYAKLVQSLDDNIGRVLTALERAGLAENTLVIFTSDNGGERFSDVWPFVGVKGEVLEGGIRVPLIMRWPGKIQPGSRSQQVMTSMDFLPTLLAAAGGTPDPAFPSDGENLLPVIVGTTKKTQPRRLFWRFKREDQAAVRDGDWKYLKIAGKEFLFNLAEDVREQVNVRNRHPAVFDRLRSLHASWNGRMLPYADHNVSVSAKTYITERY